MRLPPVFRRFTGLFLAIATALTPVAAAAGPDAAQLLAIGGAAARTGGLPALDALPGDAGVEAALQAARLKARPVSTGDEPGSVLPGAFEELFVALRAGLHAEPGGFRLMLGGEALPVPVFGARLGETLDAFGAQARRAVFLEIADADDGFPAALPGLRAALDPLGFDMTVLMVAPEGRPACTAAHPLHDAIASGLADRPPFGDGDGVTRVAEASAFLTGALERSAARGCGAAYSLILTRGPAEAPLVAHPLTPVPEAEARLDAELFEAMFLEGSERPEAVATYLESCIFCPGEARLSERLGVMAARAEIAALEEAMWDEIRNDGSPERLAIYVDHCRICAHSDAALTRIGQLQAEAAALEAEGRAFAEARAARDLAALRAYAETCLACAHMGDAEALIAELEADTVYQAERAALAAALEEGDPAALEAYLSACITCDGAGAAREALDRLAKLETARAPCLAAAGLPQMGGPRKLEDIDQAAALAACGAVAEAYPDDGLTSVILGRIAQAGGDRTTASAAYAAGMEARVPAAFGLAAFVAYTPEDGRAVDPVAVEALALEGAARGDWLSQEMLTLLYSKDLVPGKSGHEAFEVAERIAREGDALAQYFLGQYHLNGVGVAPSEPQAVHWLQQAADAGYLRAQASLAGILEHPREGPPQPGLAGELYWSALQQGDATATDRLTTDLASRSAEVVRIIQGKLREQGLYRGAVDGVPGPGTEAAVRAYAKSVTGQG